SGIGPHYPLLFPGWLTPFVKTAENNGTIPAVLQKSIGILEEDGDTAVLLFGTILVLLCYSFVIVFASFTVLAMFLPMIKLITALSS
ncbi:MAG: hypothetical protein LBN39_10890, partial [Planctomycetaceae bacterium]|nr:hypothetical protein [Planctomycetaceae bacterium]